jgi:hypothetical protein
MSENEARMALRKALEALVERGQTVAVSPTDHEMTTDQLFELADEVRNDIEPEANIVWLQNGALAYVLGLSLHLH